MCGELEQSRAECVESCVGAEMSAEPSCVCGELGGRAKPCGWRDECRAKLWAGGSRAELYMCRDECRAELPNYRINSNSQ